MLSSRKSKVPSRIFIHREYFQRIFGKIYKRGTSDSSDKEISKRILRPLLTTILLNTSIIRSRNTTTHRVLFASSIPHRRLNFLNRHRYATVVSSLRPTPPPLSCPLGAFPMMYIYIYISGGRVWMVGNDVTEGWKGERGRTGGSRGCAGVNDRPRLEVRGVQCMKPSVIATLLQSDLQG